MSWRRGGGSGLRRSHDFGKTRGQKGWNMRVRRKNWYREDRGGSKSWRDRITAATTRGAELRGRRGERGGRSERRAQNRDGGNGGRRRGDG